MTTQFIKLEKSSNKNKRYDAYFIVNGKQKKVSFGSSQHDNYTIHKDKERRDRYRQRHKNDLINVPTTPGALSWYLLWGDSTNLLENINKYKSKFGV